MEESMGPLVGIMMVMLVMAVMSGTSAPAVQPLSGQIEYVEASFV